jgi:hypothetical protein
MRKGLLIRLREALKALCLAGLFTLGPGPAATAQEAAGGPTLTFHVLNSGTVVINDGSREIARVFLYIFTGKYINHYWEGTFTFSADNAAEKEKGTSAVMVNGVPVDLAYNAERLDNGVKVHYRLAPRENVDVSLVQVYTSYPYVDWQGAPFEFNSNEGVIADDPVPESPESTWKIREANASPLLLGPSKTHDGLVFKMAAEGLNLILADNRWYDKKLCIILSHERVDSAKSSLWEKGRAKDFDFTLSYNRPMAPLSPASPIPVMTATPAPTATPLGTGCPPFLIDDFEDEGRNGKTPERTNLLGGKWALVSSPNRRIGVVYADAGAGGTRNSCGVTGTVTKDEEKGYASIRTDLAVNGTPFNAAGRGLGGIQFWMRGDNSTFWLNMTSRAVTEEIEYSCRVAPPAGVWTLLQIPFDKMIRKSWWGNRSEIPNPEGNNLVSVGFSSSGRGRFWFNIDQLAFYCVTTPTPTATSTPTSTETPTRTPSPAAKATATQTLPPFIPPPVIQTSAPPESIPTLRPTPVPRVRPAAVVIKPTSTPVRLRPTHTPKLILVPNLTPTPTATPLRKIPTPVPTWLPNLDRELTVQFTAPPANIYVTFADGSGNYRVEVVDSVGNSLGTIYGKKVVSQGDAWLEWDGRDQKSRDVPPGQYYVILYKDGKAIKSISVIRGPGWDNNVKKKIEIP